MKPLTNGKWATDEEALRLAVIDSVDRDTLIKTIVERLRAEERAKGSHLRYRKKRMAR